MSTEKDPRIEWAHEQFDKAKVQQEHRYVVERLLSSYFKDEASYHLGLKDAQEVSKLFTELVLGHNLVVETEKVWDQARPGNLVVRNEVRVKTDAYAGDVGRQHNGREGVIVAMRYGDIHVRYDDTGETARHRAEALEKRIG